MSSSNHKSLQSPDTDAKRRITRRRIRIAILALVTAILFGSLFVQATVDTLQWLRPSSVNETVSLYVLSTVNFLAFVVLLMVLARNIIKLRQERMERKLGVRFKTRLVLSFIAVSLLPAIVLFFATTGWISRSMDKWFNLPIDQVSNNARAINKSYIDGEADNLDRIAATLSRSLGGLQDDQLATALAAEADTQQLMLAQLYNKDGELIAQRSIVDPDRLGAKCRTALRQARLKALQGETFTAQLIIDDDQPIQLISAVPLKTDRGGALIIARLAAKKFVDSVNIIRINENLYDSLQDNRKRFKNAASLTLALITLLVLFIAFWLALYIGRSIADPVRQMAEATERIKRGDLSYRAEVAGDDELAALVISFNEMTAELAENRRQIEQAAAELQQSNSALDERRRYIEAILQSLSAGVISIDENLNVKTINRAALRLLRAGQPAGAGVTLDSLLPAEDREGLHKMISRAVRMPSVTREVHLTFAGGTKLDASLTVASLQDPHGQSSGAVIVIEDLTELIEAQRRAAWSEVARRIAHEIKNPLTPIRLSAERMAKNLLRSANGSGPLHGLSDRQTELVKECTSMIGAEVATLQRMVDEFSNFARLPNAKLETSSLNEVVENTLRLYDERLRGIRLESSLDPAISPVLIDCEQIKRVLVNLIDNAVEAMADVSKGNGEDSRITVSTREDVVRDAVELIVADNGPGIPPEDRERVFDPYFSTRQRGTGLGLAIVSHIVAEHQGRIRVQENLPRGSRFIVELPNAKTVDS